MIIWIQPICLYTGCPHVTNYLHATYPQKFVQKHVVINKPVVTQRVQTSVFNDNMPTNNLSIGYYLPQNMIVSKKGIVSNNVITFWKK